MRSFKDIFSGITLYIKRSLLRMAISVFYLILFFLNAGTSF